MKTNRLRKYLEARKKTRSEGTDNSIRADRKTDQDFPGYPHGTSSEEHITPKMQPKRKLQQSMKKMERKS